MLCLRHASWLLLAVAAGVLCSRPHTAAPFRADVTGMIAAVILAKTATARIAAYVVAAERSRLPARGIGAAVISEDASAGAGAVGRGCEAPKGIASRCHVHDAMRSFRV